MITTFNNLGGSKTGNLSMERLVLLTNANYSLDIYLSYTFFIDGLNALIYLNI
jgi:hypothetical protein